MKIVLSLCGGGVRGVFTARFLMHLDNALKMKYGQGIYERIDMFAGTSVGAMIAAGIVFEKRDGNYIDNMFNYKNSQ